MANPNLELLTDAAKLLEPLLGELVFVGGCATALLITDKAAAEVRRLRHQSIDPIEARREAKQTKAIEKAKALKFRDAAAFGTAAPGRRADTAARNPDSTRT